MGYRGKVREREEARRLRARNWTLAAIAQELGVSKSSVSLWVRDVPFTPSPRRWGPHRRPNPASIKKRAEIDAMNRRGLERLGVLDELAFLAAGVALYAGEGAKRDGMVMFANTDPSMMRFFARWLRHFFDVDEARLRMRVYLHEGLDIEVAESHWSDVTNVPRSQFRQPHRAVANSGVRTNKHVFGCAYFYYGCSRTHREIRAS
jgi:hypothetical protein